MALEDVVWSSWLTPQQIADLTDLGGDFGGNAAEFVETCVRDLAAGRSPVVSGHPCGREIRLVKGGFETQAKDDDGWIRVRSLNEAIAAHQHPERFPVIVGPSSDADLVGCVEAFDWGQ
jgi:hypothetical protein